MSPLYSLIGLSCCLLMVLLLQALINREDVAAGMVLSLSVLGAALTGNVPSLTISGISVRPADIGFGLLALAALARFLRLRRTSVGQRVLMLLALLCLLSLALGAARGPIPGAINDFREYLAVVSGALYFSTASLDRDTRERLGRVWLYAGAAMAVLVIVRWVGVFGGVPLGILGATYDATIRVLNGPETFFVATVAVIALLPAIGGFAPRPWMRNLGVLLFVMVIVLNRRTVWVALGVAVVALLLRNPSLGRRAAVAATAGLIVFTLAVPFLPGSAGEDRPVTQTATDTNTLVWRLEGWSSLLNTVPDSVVTYAIGMPFGSGYERQVRGQELVVSPHSFYLQTFLRVGLLGVGALLLAIWIGLSATSRRDVDNKVILSHETLFLVLMMQGVWYLTWQTGSEQGIVLGLAIATVSQDWRVRNSHRLNKVDVQA